MPLDRPDIHPFSNTSADHQRQAEALNALVNALNSDLRHHSAEQVIRAALKHAPNLALVSSFGAESVALLHLVAMVKRDLPVLFIDTDFLFTETLVYQQEVAEALHLSNVTILKSGHLGQADRDGTLHKSDPDACCALRKTRPLTAALRGFDGWITGRKRFQSGSRATLAHFEADIVPNASPRLKVNPLAYWSAGDVAEYMEENRLPRHPMVAQGYPSIGCAPCTSPVGAGEDPRAGRWRDSQKTECGIHFEDGAPIHSKGHHS